MHDGLVQAAIDGLIPPDMRPKTRRARYETAVSLCLMGTMLASALHIAQAYGFLTWVGLGGFAMAKDVESHHDILTQIQIGQLNRDLREAKTQICMAQRQLNGPALDSWSRQMQNTRGQYYAVTKEWPNVQSCEELLVPVRNASDAQTP